MSSIVCSSELLFLLVFQDASFSSTSHKLGFQLATNFNVFIAILNIRLSTVRQVQIIVCSLSAFKFLRHRWIFSDIFRFLLYSTCLFDCWISHEQLLSSWLGFEFFISPVFHLWLFIIAGQLESSLFKQWRLSRSPFACGPSIKGKHLSSILNNEFDYFFVLKLHFKKYRFY